MHVKWGAGLFSVYQKYDSATNGFTSKNMNLIDVLMIVILTATIFVVVGYRWGSRRYIPAATTIHELKKQLAIMLSTRKNWTSTELKAQIKFFLTEFSHKYHE